MANYLLPIQQFQPVNAAIDFNPLNQGLGAIRQQQNVNRKNALLDEQMALRKQQMAAQEGRAGRAEARALKADQRAQIEWFGKQASAVDQMQGPERAAAWGRIVSQHGADGLTPEELDPVTGPKLLMAQAGQFIDPTERRFKQLEMAKMEAEIGKLNREGGAAGQLGGYKDAKQLFDVEQGLRKEFNAQAKTFVDVRDAYSRVEAAAKASEKIPSVAGDIALIYNYMKMLDPGSTVMQGEYATIEQSRSLPQQVVGLYNKLITGQKLEPEQRADYLKLANDLFDTSSKSYSNLRKQYNELSKRKNVNPENTVLDYTRPQDIQAALNEARAAIQKGAPRDAVMRRLMENDIDPAGL